MFVPTPPPPSFDTMKVKLTFGQRFRIVREERNLKKSHRNNKKTACKCFFPALLRQMKGKKRNSLQSTPKKA